MRDNTIDLSNPEQAEKLLAELTDFDFSNMEPSKCVKAIGIFVDAAVTAKSVENIDKLIDICIEIKSQVNNPQLDTLLSFYISNAYDGKFKLTSQEGRFWGHPDLVSDITYLTQAYTSEGFSKITQGEQCAIITNLALRYVFVGRFIEAIELFEKALSIDKSFSIAHGSMGDAFYYYAKALYNEQHKVIFLKKSGIHLTQSLKTPLAHGDDKTKEYFDWLLDNVKGILRDAYGENDLALTYATYDLGDENEKEYRKWCLQHRLFINPLNDATELPIAAEDSLTLPGVFGDGNKPPAIIRNFSQIKQEYITARWLFYKAVHSDIPHLADRSTFVSDSLPRLSLLFNTCRVRKAGLSLALFDIR